MWHTVCVGNKNDVLECFNTFPWWQDNLSWSIHSGFMFFSSKIFIIFEGNFFVIFWAFHEKFKIDIILKLRKTGPIFVQSVFMPCKICQNGPRMLDDIIYWYLSLSWYDGRDCTWIWSKCNSRIMNHLYLWHHS